MKKYKVAAIQMASGPNVAANLTEVGRLIDYAVKQQASLIVLPENFAIMPVAETERIKAAEEFTSGPIQDFIASKAAQHGVWIVAGTLGIKSLDGARINSASILFNDAGEIVARYDKMHLFDVRLESGEEYTESRVFEAGNEVIVADTPFGGLGIAVCYDLRFPELFRAMLDKGANLFAVPSAFTARTGKAHWEVLVRARAVENLAYVIAAGQGGYHVSGRETHGDSMIVNPWGEILDRLPRGSGVVIASVDLDMQKRIRASLPSIDHRRLRSS
jgi:predicted amidohydrolase